MEALERHHDRLVFDLPPVLVSSAAIPLARHAGGVALVVRQGVTTEAQVRSAYDRLGAIPSLGVVLNRASSNIPPALLRRISNW
jgi:Mrp family chromosome partitioning ATPase